MQIIKIILSVIFIIDCIALTVVVLMQEGKQQGLGAITIMGTLFFVISVALNMLG